MGYLQAAVARRAITPPKGVFLVGYGDRTFGNRGVHDVVSATALVLDDGVGAPVAVVAADLLTMCERTVDRIRAAVAPIEVMVCCSHTHSGPISYADSRSRRRDRDFVDVLVSQIIGAVREASRRVEPVDLEWSLGECDLGVNRRERTESGIEIGENPDGPRDQSVGVLGVVASDGRRLATVIGYACHGTALGPRQRLVSADWIGAMRRGVEAELGGSALFIQGAGADINPRLSWDVEDPWAQMERAGERVADVVLDAVRAGRRPLDSTPVRLARADVWIPLQAEARTAEPPRDYVEPLLSLAGLPKVAAPLGEPLLRRRYPWRPTIGALGGRWAVPMRHSVLRVGELALVAHGAETFTEIGLAAKAASPAVATLVAGVTDGCVSYLATEEAHREGGYEVEVAPWAYRYPGLLDPSGEWLTRDATFAAFAELWP